MDKLNSFLNIFWRNAEYISDDWGFTYLGWIMIIIFVIIIIAIAINRYIKNQNKLFKEQCSEITKLGYEDLDEIQIFVDRIGAELEDFIYSKGIRKQYELFSQGESSDFIKKSEANKKSDDNDMSVVFPIIF